jgi:dihydroorotate dehydrogenase (NAD+) catalytic subunit
VLAKLRSDVVRVVESARTVLDAGAAAVVVGNALPAAMPDGRQAGLSGPAIRPLALRCVTEVRAGLPDAQIVGVGGIVTADDVRTFLAAGATAVQIGTALLHDPTAAARLVADLQPDTDPHREGAA